MVTGNLHRTRRDDRIPPGLYDGETRLRADGVHRACNRSGVGRPGSSRHVTPTAARCGLRRLELTCFRQALFLSPGHLAGASSLQRRAGGENRTPGTRMTSPVPEPSRRLQCQPLESRARSDSIDDANAVDSPAHVREERADTDDHLEQLIGLRMSLGRRLVASAASRTSVERPGRRPIASPSRRPRARTARVVRRHPTRCCLPNASALIGGWRLGSRPQVSGALTAVVVALKLPTLKLIPRPSSDRNARKLSSTLVDSPEVLRNSWFENRALRAC